MDKAILKKWWFWVIVVLAIGAIGSLGQTSDTTTVTQDENQEQVVQESSTLPLLDEANYQSEEGLVVFSELKEKGYQVTAEFENSALTDINGDATELFSALDVTNQEDRLSVDNFIVDSLSQSGDVVELIIVNGNTQN